MFMMLHNVFIFFGLNQIAQFHLIKYAAITFKIHLIKYAAINFRIHLIKYAAINFRINLKHRHMICSDVNILIIQCQIIN